MDDLTDDLDAFIEERKARDPEFARGFELGYQKFKLGVLLRQAREDAGLTQEQVAKLLHTQKSVISRMENHAEDIRLSTLDRFATAVGKTLHLAIT